jgi:hypothetical protein
MPLGMPSRGNLGNPLGRAQTVAAAAARTSRYDIRLVQNNVSIPSLPNNAASQSPTIMFNGRAITYFSNGTGPSLFRYTFDYSETGITNTVSTNVGTTTAITQLPSISTPTSTSQCNQQWSHVVSSTQILCKFNQFRPFLVTWDRGATDSSFAYPAATGVVTLLMTDADAFLLPNGNLAVFGSDGASTAYLCEYTPTLTHVRNFSLGSFTGLGGGVFQARIRRTSYGYVVGLVHVQNGQDARCMAITLNSTCTTVIASRIMTMSPGSFTTAPTMWSTILGEDGIIFVNLMNSVDPGFLNVPVFSNGSIAGVATLQYADSSQAAPAADGQPLLRSLIQQIPLRGGCTKFADALAPSLFATQSSSVGLEGTVMLGKSFSNDSRLIGYVDMQLEPVINSEASAENSTIWPADVNRTVNAAYGISIQNTVTYGVNLHFDDSGLIYLGSNSGISSPSPRLLRRVSR